MITMTIRQNVATGNTYDSVSLIFYSRTFHFHVGTFFRLQWEFQWENGQK